MTSYPPSTSAYPLLNQLLDSCLPFPVSSTSFTFTLPTVAISSSSVPLPTVASVTSSVSSTSVVPILTTTVSNTSLNTTASTASPVLSSSTSSAISTTTPTLPLHPKDAVATSPNLQQYSAVRQLTRDLQQKKPKHPRRPHLPSDIIAQRVRRLVHYVVYKQKLVIYINNIWMH